MAMNGKVGEPDSLDYQLEIIDFLEKRIGQIDTDTQFFLYTGIDGLDALELMREFGEYFGVDMSSYIYSDYHSDEADINRPFKRIFNHYFGKRKVNKIFSVSHLEKVVRKGYWFDPS